MEVGMEIEERYEFIKALGAGSFGRVYKVMDKTTGEIVALKEFKQPCDPFDYLPEIHALTALEHPNIVRLKNVVQAEGTVFMALEYMEGGSLGDVIESRWKNRAPFSEAEIRKMSFQLLQGLDHMHYQSRGFMHRDLKPDNVLVNRGVIKIGDLGAATEIDSGQPFHPYVTTRIYRAPELLLRAFEGKDNLEPCLYDEKVDMWAVGVIMAELFRLYPLFIGRSSADQLHKICEVIGAPTWDTWAAGMIAARLMKVPKLEPANGLGFRAVLPDYASDCAVDLIASLCSWDPSKRPSASEALQHPFFTNPHNVEGPPMIMKLSAALPILGV